MESASDGSVCCADGASPAAAVSVPAERHCPLQVQAAGIRAFTTASVMPTDSAATAASTRIASAASFAFFFIRYALLPGQRGLSPRRWPFPERP